MAKEGVALGGQGEDGSAWAVRPKVCPRRSQ